MQTIQLPTLVGLSRLKNLAAILALLASPLAAHAAPVTFNLTAVLPGNEGGSLTGSIDYDVDTGEVSAARILVSLIGTDDPFELTIIDPDADLILANEKKPIVIRGNVDGESSNKDHKGEVSLSFPEPPNPTTPVAFSGSFVDRFPGKDPVTYSLSGTAKSAVPEPATYALLAMGLAAAALTRRREQRT